MSQCAIPRPEIGELSVTAVLQNITFHWPRDDTLGQVRLIVSLIPKVGTDMRVLQAVLQEWMNKGAADLEF